MPGAPAAGIVPGPIREGYGKIADTVAKRDGLEGPCTA